MSKDTLFRNSTTTGEPFRFDAAVARVFPDMLRRSIPGYTESLDAIGTLAARYVEAGSTCYDLGCSLGAAAIAMRQGILHPDCRIVAVDNAPAMLERCRAVVAADGSGATPIEVVEADVRELEFEPAAMIVINYTLQFLPPANRDALLARVAEALQPGGVLVLSEKIVDADPVMNALLIEMHEEHKRRNDYSGLEISRKRAALENVLVPETIDAHRHRLADAGFRHVTVWQQHYNFVSLLAQR